MARSETTEHLGIAEADLAFFLESGVSPDIIGINHYLTSERYLDEAAERYPAALRGGNGRQVFADAEAVRAGLPPGELGPAARIMEMWKRYGRPIVITEVHHGCSRDEQLRWLIEVWKAAGAARTTGADIRAVTVWALMGTYDWNSLLTRKRDFYEPGAFDVRAPRPRRTVLAQAAASLAAAGRFDHPVLDVPGWWHRPERFYALPPRAEPPPRSARKVGLTGAKAPLTHAFARICAERGLAYVVLDTAGEDGPDILRRLCVWAVIDTDIGLEGEAADRFATERWAEACAGTGLPLVAFSSARIFDGRLGRPYVEDDPVIPADPYAQNIGDRERAIRSLHPGALLARVGPIIDPWDRDDPTVRLFASLSAGQCPPQTAEIVSPAYAPDLAHAVLDLLIDGETGLWHLANRGAIGLPQLTARLAELAGLQEPQAADETPPEQMRNRALESRRGWPMPTLADALTRFVHDIAAMPPSHGTVLAAE